VAHRWRSVAVCCLLLLAGCGGGSGYSQPEGAYLNVTLENATLYEDGMGCTELVAERVRPLVYERVNGSVEFSDGISADGVTVTVYHSSTAGAEAVREALPAGLHATVPFAGENVSCRVPILVGSAPRPEPA
jgi:hypothetical protein